MPSSNITLERIWATTDRRVSAQRILNSRKASWEEKHVALRVRAACDDPDIPLSQVDRQAESQPL